MTVPARVRSGVARNVFRGIPPDGWNLLSVVPPPAAREPDSMDRGADAPSPGLDTFGVLDALMAGKWYYHISMWSVPILKASFAFLMSAVLPDTGAG